jgi:O-antigen/teichoic acid export membrane protein
MPLVEKVKSIKANVPTFYGRCLSLLSVIILTGYFTYAHIILHSPIQEYRHIFIIAALACGGLAQTMKSQATLRYSSRIEGLRFAMSAVDMFGVIAIMGAVIAILYVTLSRLAIDGNNAVIFGILGVLYAGLCIRWIANYIFWLAAKHSLLDSDLSCFAGKDH